MWFAELKEKSSYAWKHDTSLRQVYSQDAASFLAKQDDAYYDKARKAYGKRTR